MHIETKVMRSKRCVTITLSPEGAAVLLAAARSQFNELAGDKETIGADLMRGVSAIHSEDMTRELLFLKEQFPNIFE